MKRRVVPLAVRQEPIVKIFTLLPFDSFVSLCQKSAHSVSEPRRSRRRTHVRLAFVGYGELHYVDAEEGQEAIFTVRIETVNGQTRATLAGACDSFVSELGLRLRAIDPAATWNAPDHQAGPASSLQRPMMLRRSGLEPGGLAG
ncbi:MAG: hypothetical protein ACLPN6_20370 [Streptosporangiaceae bacterium]|jgi:hypothetical protein